MEMRKTILQQTATLIATTSIVLTPVAAPHLAHAGVAPEAVNSAAAPEKVDALGRPTVSPRQISDQDGYFDSHNGSGVKIYYRVQKVANPRGNVVVVHGVSEHSGRFDYVAKRLLDAGYNVYRLDHRGHGKSASGSTPLGHIDNFQFLMNDLDRVVDMAKSDTPNVKTFLLGHSMGALTVEAYGIREPGKVDGIISNGGGAPLNLSGKNVAGQVVTPDQITELQRNLQPNLFERLPLAEVTSFNAHYAQNLIPHRAHIGVQSPEWTKQFPLTNPFTEGLTTSQAVKDDYASDPLNSKPTPGTVLQLVALALYDAVNADMFTTPTLIMHGTKDGIVPAYFSRDWYNAITSTDVTFVNWEGQMHEVFNEPAADQAIDTSIDWLNRHI